MSQHQSQEGNRTRVTIHWLSCLVDRLCWFGVNETGIGRGEAIGGGKGKARARRKHERKKDFSVSSHACACMMFGSRFYPILV